MVVIDSDSNGHRIAVDYRLLIPRFVMEAALSIMELLTMVLTTGTETLTASNGCDSIVTVTVIESPLITGTFDHDL